MIHDRLISLIFRIISFIIIAAGLLSQIGIFSGTFRPSVLMYYTIQSNILAAVLFALLLYTNAKAILRNGKKGSAGFFARYEMVCVIDLLLTLIVFWAMLAPRISSGSFYLWSFSNLAVHLFAPVLCLADYILFATSSHLKYRDVFYVLIFPLLYVVYTSAAGLLGYVYWTAPDSAPVRFPYFFFDFDRIGAMSLVYIGILVIFFLILSHGLYLFDRKIKKPVFFGK